MAEQTERRSEQARRTGRGNGETADDRNERPRQAAENGQAALETITSSASEMFAGWQRIQAAWLGYLQEQLREAAEAGRELSRCRSPSEALEVQVRFARTSMDRFLNGTARVAELTSELATAGLEPLQTGFPAQASEGRSEQRR